ncbi:UDP-N-acetylglucosamine:LPS N-acetylglucosamine transferase [Massilia sp. UYP11]|uniref:hypothetical protein n=1 Tax=Massilia sp. UYP11 TaxID=1756385 RepID=UPI003D21F2E2
MRLYEPGVPAHAVHVAGMPTMPAFARPLGRAECARELGLAPAQATLLLMGGGAGLGGLNRVSSPITTPWRENAASMVAPSASRIKRFLPLLYMMSPHPIAVAGLP